MQTSESILTTDRRSLYQRRMLEIRGAFETGGSGTAAIAARTSAIDELILDLWQDALLGNAILASGVTVLAIGGYGRRELFPCSDVDLLFLLDAKVSEKEVKEPIRRICQQMWDSGIRVAQAIRRLAECERFSEDNAEFTFAIMDHRLLAGDVALYYRLANEVVPKLIERDRNAILDRLLALTQDRHAKYGSTLFHLEPNIKECPGGLRDVHVCGCLTVIYGV
jgi:[protein-PII] uridylyltransferase